MSARSIQKSLVSLGVALAMLGAMSTPAGASQDLRSPDARDAARTSSLAGTVSQPAQDLRSPDASDAARKVEIARMQERYYANQSFPSRTVHAAPAGQPAGSPAQPAGSPGTDWLAVALSSAITLAVVALAMVAVRLRRRRAVGHAV